MITRGFLNELSATEIGEYDGRAVLKLNPHLDFRLDRDRIIRSPSGFETDLGSVPRLPVVWWLWGDRAHRECVLHDYCYRKDAVVLWADGKMTPITRADADWYFRLAMISRGQPYWIYQPMYLAVRIFGGSSFRKMKVTDHFV